jgi:hypothetical protein
VMFLTPATEGPFPFMGRVRKITDFTDFTLRA